jgi:hypothetical protein
VPLQRGALYALLANPIYIGLTRHKGDCYPGQHQPIIDQALWDAVQRRLQHNAVNRREHRTTTSAGFLTGKLFDEHGKRPTPTYARKQRRQYRYYVSQSLIRGIKAAASENLDWRIPAAALENIVATEVSGLLGDPHRLMTILKDNQVETDQVAVALAAATRQRAHLTSGTDRGEPLAELIHRVEVHSRRLVINIRHQAVGLMNESDRVMAALAPTQNSRPNNQGHITWTIPLHFRRRGQEMRLVISGQASRAMTGLSAARGAARTRTDATLIKAIAQARSWFAELRSGKTGSMAAIAKREACTPNYVSRLLPLAFLAPDLLEAIVEGTHPVELTVASLTRGRPLPCSWAEQRRALKISR